VAVDGSGNVFIADTSNFRIREVSPSGIIRTIAGTGASGFGGDGGPATNAQLDSSSGVAVDGSGSVFIADSGNNRIRLVTGVPKIVLPPSGIGAFDSASGTWYLRNEDSTGAPDAGQFAYGLPGWKPVTGRFKTASALSAELLADEGGLTVLDQVFSAGL
jgi:hypothetical protein